MRKFVWKKWIDPLGSNLDEVNFPGFDDIADDERPRPWELYSTETDMPHTSTHAINPDDMGRKIFRIAPKRIINTKHGLMTIFDSSLTQYRFDFWELHCNFDIEEADAEVISACPGVETFEVTSRYSCRIGFPRSGLFNVTECKQGIEQALINMVGGQYRDMVNDKLTFESETEEEIQSRLEELRKFPYWLLYVFPNGQIRSYSSELVDAKFDQQYQEYSELCQAVGGRLYTC